MVERRQSPRLMVNSPVLVSLDKSEAGLLFDVGEGGLSIRGLVPQRRREPIRIAFDLPEGNGSVYAWVGIAWTSDSKNRTGLCFVKVAERMQKRLKTWVGSKVCATNLEVAGGASVVTVFPGMNSTAIPSRGPTDPESEVAEVAAERTSRSRKLRRQFIAVLVVAILWPVFFLLGHYLPRIIRNQNPKEIVIAPTAHEGPSSTETVSINSSVAKTPALPSGIELNMPGFVLQVAEMSRKENADALAAALNQKKFPAFAFRRGNDHFYKVLVGPYPDVRSSNQVKDQLQRENYQALREVWSPE